MKGFTLIEVIIALSISTLVISFAAVKYVDFNRTQVIKNAGATLKNNLRDTQTKAIAGIRPTNGCSGNLAGYQVTFPNNTTYTTDAFCNALSNNPTTYTLPPNLIFHDLPDSFRFNILAQGVSAARAIFIRSIDTISIQTKWYGICVATSGDIIDTGNCGYKVQSAQPACTCT